MQMDKLILEKTKTKTLMVSDSKNLEIIEKTDGVRTQFQFQMTIQSERSF